MHILTYKEIDEVCRRTLANAKEQKSDFLPHIYFLYHFGVRIGEVFNNHITHIDKEDFIYIYPQKKNNLRKIKVKDSSTANMLESLHLKKDIQQINYKALQREPYFLT